ncbi:hypothetical protein [Shivajiella indica]|uniref:Uncharacterized protein n=1 Tax=Shivajiella indica TaxID=872115 RepID=A0ABW5BF15_9BACT
MKIFREIFKRSRALGWFGLLNFVTFFILLILSFYDDRMLLGANIWHKPMKFCLSIGTFSWTMAWYLYYLSQPRKVQTIKIVIILMLLIEQVIIIGQASRGEMSHFNITTAFNAMLFNIMGIAIFVNTLMVFWSFRLLKNEEHLPVGYKRSIQLGMLIFIIASLQGFVMAANLGHTIGAPDGLEGIFFLNWAKGFIDLRVFHFFGLHALQVIPIFAWIFAKNNVKAVTIFGILYFIFSFGTLWIALF